MKTLMVGLRSWGAAASNQVGAMFSPGRPENEDGQRSVISFAIDN